MNNLIAESIKVEDMKCGDANPSGNIALFYKGSCAQVLDISDAYRCTGCDARFHKFCILSHFRLEKEHDYGRQEERNLIARNMEKLRNMTDHLITTLGSMPPEEADQIVFNIAHLIYTDILGLKGEIKKTKDIIACAGKETQEVREYKFIEKL